MYDNRYRMFFQAVRFRPVAVIERSNRIGITGADNGRGAFAIFLFRSIDKKAVKLHHTGMKISNFFTGSRLFLSPIIFAVYFLPDWVSFVKAEVSIVILIVLFIYAEFTDFLDGYYARCRNQVDDFGKIFDPFADVVINITVMFCFMLDGFFHPVLFLIILYREFGIMFLRMKARGEGLTIGAKKGGKAKTVFYITALGVSLFLKFAGIYGFLPQPYFVRIVYFNRGLYIAAAGLSLLSFADYLLSYKKAEKERS